MKRGRKIGRAMALAGSLGLGLVASAFANPNFSPSEGDPTLGEPILASPGSLLSESPQAPESPFLNLGGRHGRLEDWLGLLPPEALSSSGSDSAIVGLRSALIPEHSGDVAANSKEAFLESLPPLAWEMHVESPQLNPQESEPTVADYSSPQKRDRSVPEPASVVLLITGLIGLAARRRLLMRPHVAVETPHEEVAVQGQQAQ